MRNIIDDLQLQYQTLSKSEKKIADYVIQNREETLNAGITDFAEKINVSTATITRFCKKINCQSFIQFKVLLQDSLTNINKDDNFIHSTKEMYSSIIQSSHSLIDMRLVDQAAHWLIEASNIHLYGIGSSSLSAEEIKLRLHRMKLNAETHLDSHTMLMNASIVNEEDVVLVISNSGQTREVLEAVRLVKKNKARVIALTNHDHTPLSSLSDLTLFTASYRAYKESNFINSQLSIMFAIDVLSRILLDNPSIQDHYKRTLEVLNEYKKI